jgi:membrane fusion protein (multidrug efflux system)
MSPSAPTALSREREQSIEMCWHFQARISSLRALGRGCLSCQLLFVFRENRRPLMFRSGLPAHRAEVVPMITSNKAAGWFALALACASITIAGCSPQAAAKRAAPPPVVSVVAARQMTVPIVAEPIGTTTSLQEISIRARVRGFLKEIHFQEGADVKRGQLLFVIDEEPFRAKLAEAQAALEQAEAALKKARDSKAREVAAAQLEVGKSMLALSEVEERREELLYKRNASSLEEVQRKQALHQKDAAQVESEKASLDQAKADFETNILATKADVDGAKAKLADAQIDLSYCRLSSPIDGRIGFLQVKLGNLVGPATGTSTGDYTELAVVRQLDPMGVDFEVPSRYLDRITRLISQGLPIEIFRPGLQGEEARRFRGKATIIDNTINPTTSTFRVRGEVANPAKTILPGEYVKSRSQVGEVKDAIVVPEQAVVEAQAGPTVFTVDKQGKVATVGVKASFTYEGLRVIESGLQAGQDVIVEGMQMVRNGITVKTQPAALQTRTTSEGSAAKAVDEKTNTPDGAKPRA